MTDAAELVAMFSDIQGGAGRAYITLKQLQRWDELVELVEAGFASQEAVDAYLVRLGACVVVVVLCHSCYCVSAMCCVLCVVTPAFETPLP